MTQNLLRFAKKYLIGLSLVGSLFSTQLSLSEEIAELPILRLQSWMHTTRVTRIGIDQEGRFLVSSSKDKTIKIWDIPGRRLIDTIRPPIGPGEEGTMNAVAISPDGQTIVAGGFAKADQDSHYLYLFDRRSQKMIGRLSGHQTPIYHLAFSPDGKYLVATMDRDAGIKIYRTSVDSKNWELVVEDSDYKNRSYWAVFDSQGRLATSSMDGFVRLYDSGFNLPPKKVDFKSGKEPFGISFSPDGKYLAVGFTDSEKVNVLSGNDLSFIYEPYTSDVTNGNLSITGWSADGKTLIAGGEFAVENLGWGIRFWSDGGKENSREFRDIIVSKRTIADLRSLPNGEIAFGSLDPFIGFINSTGNVTYVKESSWGTHEGHADYRGIGKNFLVSETGDTIQFSYEILNEAPKRFTISQSSFVPLENPDSELHSPLQSIDGVEISNWENKENPMLNGKPLAISNQERSQSFAISPDKDNNIILGADRHVYCFLKNGDLKWVIPTESEAWSVNITGNGKLALAALGDGTIQWYDIDKGIILLTFFPHPDRLRWILWAPNGFYSVSPGAEDLIGWHINNGWENKATFFTIDRYRNDFNQPRLIAETLTDKNAILNAMSGESNSQSKEFRKKLPPEVIVEFPENEREVGTPQVVFRVKVLSNTPIKGFKVKVNKRPWSISDFRRVKFGIVDKRKENWDINELWNILVPISSEICPEEKCHFTIIAENQFKENSSPPISIKWKGNQKANEQNLFILAIGINYKNHPNIKPSDKLKYAYSDARDLVGAFMKQKGILYKEVIPRILTDDPTQDAKIATEAATHENIRKGLDWLVEKTKPQDLAILFIAGHGVSFHENVYSFLPENFDPNNLSNTRIDPGNIWVAVGSIKGRVVVMLDTCRSVNLLPNTGKWADSFTTFLNSVNNDNGGVVYIASTGIGVSQEIPSNGRFTGAVLSGLLQGKAVIEGSEEITTATLGNYVRETVKKATFGIQAPGYFPTNRGTEFDFTIARKLSN